MSEWNDQIHHILKSGWGFDKFREGQQEIIESVLDGNDVLALLPTGGGKSICFQVPAIALPGLCLVVSPLIALMKDQVENLVRKGIPAKCIVSGMKPQEIDLILEDARKKKIKFLYVSPERLETELFLARIDKLKISMVAVDESHCISQWGYDFRPSYLRIAEIRKFIDVPVIALTATATLNVVEDIQEKLEFKKKKVFRKSFTRSNLAYLAIEEENKLNRLLRILQKTPGSGVIYVRNRKKTEEIADYLRRNHVNADFYHAGLDADSRDRKQASWKTGQTRMIVCTNAFGMGIDKPDVRVVVHLDIPDCIEAYFQEAGRGGRDEQKAYAVILYNKEDIGESRSKIDMSFPDPEDIKKVYQSMGNFFNLANGSGAGQSFEFDIRKFSSTFNLSMSLVFHSLKFLEKEGYVTLNEDIYLGSRFKFTCSNLELYDFQLRNKTVDPFIKLLLRNYSGSFDDYVSINEFDIGRKAKVPVETVYQRLKFLEQSGILTYIRKAELPQVFYNREKMDAKNVVLSKENYEKRKEGYIFRLEKMIDYLTQKEACRSKVLVQYFGETSADDCGHCDVCLKKIAADQSESGKEINTRILSFLKSEALDTQDLIKKINLNDDQKVMKILRNMLDEGEVRLDGKGKFIIKE